MDKVIEAVKAGKLVIVGEYRGSKVETINYVDKKTGQAASFKNLVHLVERGVESLLVSQPVPKEIDPDTVKIQAIKGKQYMFELSSFERVKGSARARMVEKAEPVAV